MRDQLRALVKLAEIDDSARELERELEEIPAHVEEMRADLARLDAMLEQERRELADAEQLRDAQLEQVAQSTDALSRAKAKGAKARNAREVDAAEREMETVRRGIRERQEENAKLSEAIDQKGLSLLERELKLDEFRKIFEEEEASGKIRLEELRGELTNVTQGREAVAKELPRPIVGRYDRVRKKIGSALAEVVDGTCGGCRLHIPPQQFNVLLTGTTVEQCPHCLRMLFHKQAIAD